MALRSLIKKPGRHSDGGGLYFRVLPGHKCYWVYRYTVAGKERETSLGPYPELGLAEARIQHAELRKMVKVDRADPIAEKRRAKASVAQPSTKPSFGHCADEFVETHKTGWRNAKHAWQWKQSLTTHAAVIRDLPVDEVDTEAVLRVLTPLWGTVPETAARLRGRIEAVLASAQVDGWIPEDKPNPARWRNWLERKLPKRQRLTRGHHAAMAHGDVAEFVQRLRREQAGNVTALALEFLILTATRTGETLGAQWDDEISFADATWVIPNERMKMGEAFSVPLSEAALRLLGDQMGERGRSPYVFPGRPRQPLSGMAMSMLLRRMGVDATVHGFRTSFRTWCSDVAHVEFEVAESCLSHRVGSAVSRAYARSDMLDRRRPIMEAWANYVEGKNDATVIPIRRAHARAPRRLA